MPEKYTYLLVDFFCILFPFLFSFHPRIRFYKEWKHFLLPCLLTATFFIAWDILFTHLNVWSFNTSYVIGLYVFNLPIEEILFFICIPYACVFSYFCFDLFFKKLQRFQKGIEVFYLILSITLLVIAGLHISQLYTSVTFILLAFLLIYEVRKKRNYLSTFFFCFLFILIPFFISNGILTGSFINRTVVMYNDQHNLGIRMLTIPVEDTFYGMLLLLMNVTGFELMKKKKNNL